MLSAVFHFTYSLENHGGYKDIHLPSKIRRNLEIFPIIINALAISCFACTSLKNVIIKAAPYLEEIQYYTPINLLLRTVQLRFMCTYTVTFRALLATPSILN